MNTPLPVTEPASINLGDIYYILFRHKWKIIICSLLGLAVAANFRSEQKESFQSEAKLFVRYVISEGKSIGPIGGDATKSPDQRGETIMSSEIEILGSSDLVRLVVEAIGAERILAKAGGGDNSNAAVQLITQNLTIGAPRGSSVIQISFKHPDAELVQPILREVVDRYLKMHVEIHRASGLLGDLFSQETDRLRSRLLETEDELRKVRNRAGVLSLEDAKKSYTEQVSSLRQQIYSVQADLATRISILGSMSKNVEANVAPVDVVPVEAPIPQEIIDDPVSCGIGPHRFKTLFPLTHWNDIASDIAGTGLLRWRQAGVEAPLAWPSLSAAWIA